MPNYRRAFQPGGTFFLTLVTERRAPIFAAGRSRTLLRVSIVSCRRFHPFDLEAIVLLHDHLHLLIALPDGDADFSRRITAIKYNFTRLFLAGGAIEQERSTSRVRQRVMASGSGGSGSMPLAMKRIAFAIWITSITMR